MQTYQIFRRKSSQNLIKWAGRSQGILPGHTSLLSVRGLRPPRRRTQPLLKLSDLLILMALFWATVACTCAAFVAGQVRGLRAGSPAKGQVSRQIFIQPHLPTLTPTAILASGVLLPSGPAPADAPAESVAKVAALNSVEAAVLATPVPVSISVNSIPARARSPLTTVVPLDSPSLASTWTPSPMTTRTDTPLPAVTLLPADTPMPNQILLVLPPTSTPLPTATPVPEYDFLLAEFFNSSTT